MRGHLKACALILAVAGPLLVAGLWLPSLANDEAVYCYWTSLGWGDMMRALAGDNYPPLYFVMLKLWRSAAGTGEVALRLSSVPFALATVWLLWAWCRCRLGGRVAALAAGLLAASPLFLFLARLGKYFALFGLLALAATLLLWTLTTPEVRRRPLRAQPRTVAAWLVVTALLPWVHYLGFAVWFALGVWLAALLVAERGACARAWRLAGGLGAAALLFAPQAWVVARQVAAVAESAGAGAAPPPVGWARTLVQLGYTAHAFVLGHTVEVSRLWPTALALAAGAVALGAGMLAVARGAVPGTGGVWGGGGGAAACEADGGGDATGRAGGACPEGSVPRGALPFCLLMFALQAGAAYAVIRVSLPGLHDLAVCERLAFALPLLMPVAAAGLLWLPRRWRMVLAVAYGVPLVVSLGGMVTNRENNVWDYVAPWRGIAADVARLPAPRAVVFDNWHLGSRGWYYLSGDAAVFVPLRQAAEGGGGVDAAIGAALARRPASVVLVRSRRDSSPGSHVDAASRALAAALGPPDGAADYVRDSDATMRLKRLMRRGTGVETFDGKLRAEWWVGR